jgi:hypothetical protein
MSYKIVYKYTSRSRPDKFFRGLESIRDNSVDNNYEVICSFDEDDETMNCDVVKSMLPNFENVKWFFGKSESKIHAINRDIDKFPEKWDILVNMSDDMVFTKYGFDNIIREAFDREDLFVHFHDGNQNRLSTLTIEDKKHFDRFGYIYHPDYISVFSDNEAQDVAKMLSCYKYVGDDVRIFEHRHPLHNKAYKMDAQYVHTESFYQFDMATYYRRKSINFNLLINFSL